MPWPASAQQRQLPRLPAKVGWRLLEQAQRSWALRPALRDAMPEGTAPAQPKGLWRTSALFATADASFAGGIHAVARHVRHDQALRARPNAGGRDATARPAPRTTRTRGGSFGSF